MAWLDDWKYRQKISVDHTLIGSNLTHFPLTIQLNSTDHSEIFTELGTNSQKIAITKSDGETQIYAEVEYWDSSKAVLHASKSDLVISSSTDTELYLYFDSTKSDNTTYIGTLASAVGQNVWDSNYKMVNHMGSSLNDSTSNGNNGTATGTTLVDGLNGKARSFNGTSDYIQTTLDTTSWDDMSFVSVAKSPITTVQMLYWEGDSAGNGRGTNDERHVDLNSTGIECWVQYSSGTDANVFDTATYTDYILVKAKMENMTTGSDAYAGHDKGAFSSQTTSLVASTAGFDTNARIGRTGTAERYFGGVADEVRFSDTIRTDDWMNAEYDSLFDNLNTFDTVETLAMPSALFFSMNF